MRIKLRLRFTEFSSLSGEEYLLYLGISGRQLEACHSSFFNGSMAISMYDGIYQTIGLTNNVTGSVNGIGIFLTASLPPAMPEKQAGEVSPRAHGNAQQSTPRRRPGVSPLSKASFDIPIMTGNFAWVRPMLSERPDLWVGL